jgi:hypothetical protein
MVRDLIKVEHVWSEQDDRWMLIERYKDTNYVGLNYMQGDDYQHFKESWCKVDSGLSDFYNQMKITFNTQWLAHTEIEFINDVMWTYHNAIACYEEYEHIPLGPSERSKIKPNKNCICK